MEAPSLHEQLRTAWEASGLSLEQLRDRAGVECSADSLSRKLRGKQPLTTREAELLALALTVNLVVQGVATEAAAG
jgi:transcriptional regulator with XRE-family HTH domain